MSNEKVLMIHHSGINRHKVKVVLPEGCSVREGRLLIVPSKGDTRRAYELHQAPKASLSPKTYYDWSLIVVGKMVEDCMVRCRPGETRPKVREAYYFENVPLSGRRKLVQMAKHYEAHRETNSGAG